MRYFFVESGCGLWQTKRCIFLSLDIYLHWNWASNDLRSTALWPIQWLQGQTEQPGVSHCYQAVWCILVAERRLEVRVQIPEGGREESAFLLGTGKASSLRGQWWWVASQSGLRFDTAIFWARGLALRTHLEQVQSQLSVVRKGQEPKEKWQPFLSWQAGSQKTEF